MRFLVVTACLAAFVVFVISERCHKDDDPEVVCVLTFCPGNNTVKICEHDECTCAVDTNIHCTEKLDCQHLPENCEHHPPHLRAPPKPCHDRQWHCLDSSCKFF